MSQPMLFLFDERNRPFVEGQMARPPASLRATIFQRTRRWVPLIFFLTAIGLPGLYMMSVLVWPIAGRSITGTVIHRYTEDDSDGNPMDMIAYRYTLDSDSDTTYQGTDQVDDKLRHSLEDGGPVLVQYVIFAPWLSTAGPTRPFELGGGIVGLLMFGVPAGLALWELRREFRLFAKGRRVPVEITSYRIYQCDDGGDHVHVLYNVCLADGASFSDSLDIYSRALVHRAAPDCPVAAAALYLDLRTYVLL